MCGLTVSAESRRGGSQPGSESEGGDQPSAENSASSGSRSSSLDNPKKRSKKVRLEEEGRQEKKEKKTRGAPNFFSPLSAKNCLPVLTFFLASTTREKTLQSTKLSVRNVKLPACVFQPGSRIPH